MRFQPSAPNRQPNHKYPPPSCTADTEGSLVQLDEPTPDDSRVEAETYSQLSADKQRPAPSDRLLSVAVIVESSALQPATR